VIFLDLTNLFYFVGKKHEASQLFTKMQEEGIKPGLVCTRFILPKPMRLGLKVLRRKLRRDIFLVNNLRG
jgi:hypothetical protein